MNESVSLDTDDEHCDEVAWRAALRRLPSWSPPASRTVVVVPHPDDEVLGTGGLVAHQRRRSQEVVVVAVTDGEAAYADAPDLGRTRIGEQLGALARLGVAADRVIRLGLPDGQVARHCDELAAVVASLADADTLLVAPWKHDVHPDHEGCGQAVLIAAVATGADAAFSLFWAWHRMSLASMPIDRMVRLGLDDDLVAARFEALVCHSSQLARDAGPPILPLGVLGPMTRPYEVYVR